MKEKPRIVFLDASTMDAGDIDFSPLRQFGTLILHKTTDHNQTLERIAEAERIIQEIEQQSQRARSSTEASASRRQGAEGRMQVEADDGAEGVAEEGDLPCPSRVIAHKLVVLLVQLGRD